MQRNGSPGKLGDPVIFSEREKTGKGSRSNKPQALSRARGEEKGAKVAALGENRGMKETKCLGDGRRS